MKSRDDLRRIAEELLLIAGARESSEERNPSTEPSSYADPGYLAGLARALYRARQLRMRHLPSALLGEPAWDILLDLFIAKSRGKRISITSACIASQVPPTTALRWIALLVEEGWVVREEDEEDRRRAFVRLSQEGENAIIRFLIEAGDVIRPIPAAGSVFRSWRK